MTVDPHQLSNIVDKMSPQFLEDQNKRLVNLSMCKGPTCKKDTHPDKERLDGVTKDSLYKI